MECFDRIEECEFLWQQFSRGRNVLMLAPRRVGKTVLLHRLREMAAERRYRAVILDLQGYHEVRDFSRVCCAAIQEEMTTGNRVLTGLTARLKRLTGSAAPPATGDWRQWLAHMDGPEFAEHLLAHLDAHGDDPPWALLVDELPIFVQELMARHDARTATSFLYWLRNMRQKYPNVRWVYAGSIGLDTIARRNSAEGALVDLETFSLQPFDAITARAFIADLGRRRGAAFDTDAVEAIIDRVGWLSPYYLEKAAEFACGRNDGLRSISVAEVNAAMARLLELESRLYWSTWREHLDRNFVEPERGRLYLVLAQVARRAEGASDDVLLAALNGPVGAPVGRAILRDLLDTLQADGYVDRVGASVCFRMNLLRSWWLRYVVVED